MAEKKATNKYYEIILDWFKQQITSGELKEGDLIPSERELAARFGVSRVPVREAMRILEYIGIIVNSPDGMTVGRVDLQLMRPRNDFAAEVTKETIENLFEVRIFLEAAAAYYAAQRRTEEDIELIRQSVREMAEAIEGSESDRTSFIRSSHEFHFRIISAAKNPVLEHMYRNLYDLLEVSKQYSMNPSSVSDSTLMDHEAILYKIESGSADEASRYMKYHLTRALKRVLGEKEE